MTSTIWILTTCVSVVASFAVGYFRVRRLGSWPAMTVMLLIGFVGVAVIAHLHWGETTREAIVHSASVSLVVIAMISGCATRRLTTKTEAS